MSVSKPEITEYSCIKAKELMVKWESYHKQEMDKLREDFVYIIDEVCNAGGMTVNLSALLKTKIHKELTNG